MCCSGEPGRSVFVVIRVPLLVHSAAQYLGCVVRLQCCAVAQNAASLVTQVTIPLLTLLFALCTKFH